jgi:putative ABC transport system permease protein
VTQQAIIALLVRCWPPYSRSSRACITVRQAISNTGSGARLWQRPARSAAQPFAFHPRTASLTIRNTFRRKGRVLLTETTLILAGVVFIMVMSSAASFTYTINWLTDVLGLRVLINFQRPLRIDEVMTVIDAQPNVDKWRCSCCNPARLSGTRMPRRAKMSSSMRCGRNQPACCRWLPGWLLPEDGHAVVLNRDRAEKV